MNEILDELNRLKKSIEQRWGYNRNGDEDAKSMNYWYEWISNIENKLTQLKDSEFERGYLKCADDFKHILDNGIKYNELKKTNLK